MDDLKIQEVNRYISPFSILVITPKKIVRLYCPFNAKVVIPVGLLKPDQLVKVDQVKTTQEKQLVFLIERKAYYYYHFWILI